MLSLINQSIQNVSEIVINNHNIDIQHNKYSLLAFKRALSSI